MECSNCGKEFESRRSSAKYCGPRCRKLAFRNAKAKGNAKADFVTLTKDNFEQVLDKACYDDYGITQAKAKGVCWVCGEKIDDRLVCCGPCAWSGKAKAMRTA